MGKTKKDLARKKQKIRKKIELLEPKVRADPLKKHPKLHEELAKLKSQLN